MSLLIIIDLSGYLSGEEAAGRAGGAGAQGQGVGVAVKTRGQARAEVEGALNAAVNDGTLNAVQRRRARAREHQARSESGGACACRFRHCCRCRAAEPEAQVPAGRRYTCCAVVMSGRPEPPRAHAGRAPENGCAGERLRALVIDDE